jgi:predicted nucleotidyltransferase
VGTTVWVDDETRKALRRLQRELGADSVNATIQRLLERRALDARTVFALHRDAIKAVLKRHRLRRLVAFGSRARGDAGPTSDLDLAVEAAPQAGPLAILAAEADLEEATGLRVNLVELPNARLQDAIEREGVPFAG